MRKRDFSKKEKMDQKRSRVQTAASLMNANKTLSVLQGNIIICKSQGEVAQCLRATYWLKAIYCNCQMKTNIIHLKYSNDEEI